METNLASFRNDLAAVSADIETLQARSTSLTVRLENRKAVEKGLGPIVEELSVSPLVVSKIAEGPIDDAWIKALAEVDKRSASFRKDAASSRPSKAMADLGPLLEKLVQKVVLTRSHCSRRDVLLTEAQAVERIRDFLVAQIKALRSPNINAQIIQQQNFLKYQDLFTFLHKHHAVLAEEICLAYMNTMRWYYITQFTRYSKALEKIKLHVLDKSDVLGHDDGPSSRSRSTARTSGPPHDAFSLGRRMDLLRTGNQSALPSHVAEDDSATHYLEVPFRNFNLALVDNATAEYTFLTRFFSPAQSHAIISRNFTYIFEPTFTLGQSLTRQLITDTYDTLGLLLAIRINQQFAFELQRRRVPVLDGYVNATNMLLWPRLQLVMGHHSESVRALSSKPSGSSSAAAASSAAPHVVTQRFGQLLHGILTLSTGSAGNPGDMSGHTGTGNDDEPVFASVGRLRADVEAFLTRLAAATFPSDRRRRDRFLYNNYSLVLTIISDVPGRLAAEQREHFEGLKKNLQE